jgi:hypothetical protein
VTNFDLSTYIRWLKPRTNTSLAAHEPQAITEPQTMASPTGYTPREESKSLFFHTNPLLTSDYLDSPPKQEVLQSKTPLKSSSTTTTALGLLLRSSIFKELVEKNSNLSEDDSDGEEPKNIQAQIGSDDDLDGIFYDGVGDIPFVCTSNGDGIELQLHFLNGPHGTA